MTRLITCILKTTNILFQDWSGVVGILSSFEDGRVTIAAADAEVVLEKSEISKLTTVFFDEDSKNIE